MYTFFRSYEPCLSTQFNLYKFEALYNTFQALCSEDSPPFNLDPEQNMKGVL